MNISLYFASFGLFNGLYSIVLDFLSLISIFSGVLVITSKNPIVSVLYLICLFLVIAIYLILVGMHFIGLSYLLVYIGAIAILFLFTIMLINIRVSELTSNTFNSLPLAVIFSTIIFNSFQVSIVSGVEDYNVYISSSCKWDGGLTNSSDISSIGNIMYSSYSVWLLITGFILLLAMVGVITISLSSSKNIYNLPYNSKPCPRGQCNTKNSSLFKSDIRLNYFNKRSFHTQSSLFKREDISELEDDFELDNISELERDAGSIMKGKIDVKTSTPIYFESLSACVRYFRCMGFKPIGNTLRSYIESGKVYNGYILEWDEDQVTVHSRAKSISITDLDTGKTTIYNSTRDAERQTKIWSETLKKYANSKEPYKGLKISFLTNRFFSTCPTISQLQEGLRKWEISKGFNIVLNKHKSIIGVSEGVQSVRNTIAKPDLTFGGLISWDIVALGIALASGVLILGSILGKKEKKPEKTIVNLNCAIIDKRSPDGYMISKFLYQSWHDGDAYYAHPTVLYDDNDPSGQNLGKLYNSSRIIDKLITLRSGMSDRYYHAVGLQTGGVWHIGYVPRDYGYYGPSQAWVQRLYIPRCVVNPAFPEYKVWVIAPYRDKNVGVDEVIYSGYKPIEYDFSGTLANVHSYPYDRIVELTILDRVTRLRNRNLYRRLGFGR